MNENRALLAAGMVAGVAAVAITAACVWLSPLNQDEGWYLYAALESAAGRLPYRDFFFTQGPLLPVIYGWLVPLWAGAGVLGGRLLTALFGLAAAMLAALLAGRAVPATARRAAAIIAFTLTACGVYHATFTAIPKTYALAALFFTGGLLALTRSVQGGRGARLRAVEAGLLLAAAAGTRLSLGAALAAAGLWLLWQRRRCGDTWIAFGLGGVLGLVLVYGPFIAAAPEGFRFAQTFHTGRTGGGALFVAGSLARLLRGYLPLAAVGIATAAWRLATGCRHEDALRDAAMVDLKPLWLLSAAAVAGVHLLSPYPYDDYQVPLMPVVAAAAAVWLAETATRAPRAALARVAAVWGVLLFSGAAAVASPRVQEWFVVRQDRFWVTSKTTSDLAVLRRVGASLRRPGSRETAPLLLTPDTYLAVESGRRVPAGLEMGPFSYFPELETSQARRLLILNRELLFNLLDHTEAPDAAMSGYAWALGAPSMAELDAAEQRAIRARVADRYRLAATVPDFGQGWTTLELWQRREARGGEDGAREKDIGPTDPASWRRSGDRPSAIQAGRADSGQGDGGLPPQSDL